MDENDKVTQYLVPANVSAKFEIFPGFGWNEIKLVSFGLLIGVLLFFALGVFQKTELIDINELSDVQKIGLDTDKMHTNSDGLYINKINIVPKPLRLILGVLPAAVVFFVVKRDPSSGMSLISMLKGQRDFASRQKRYYYKYESGRIE